MRNQLITRIIQRRHRLGLVLVTHNLVKRLVTGTSQRHLVIQQLTGGIQQTQEPPASKGTPSDLRQEGGVMIFTGHRKLPLATKHARAVIIVEEATTSSQIHRTSQAPVINITGQTLI